MHLAYHHPISMHQYRAGYESRVTDNVRSDTDSFRFLLMMEAWRNTLVNVSHGQFQVRVEGP